MKRNCRGCTFGFMSDEKESASARETIRAAFKTFDADDSGRVDASELAELVSSLGGILTEGDLQSAMRILDKDGNGYIDYVGEHFCTFLTITRMSLSGGG
ncbi:unnamed protein product [Aphanomyces euteiches]